MSKRRYLVLLRRQTSGDAGQAGGGEGGPSPAEMQQMFAAYNAWKEKFRDEILDLGDRLRSDGRVLTPSGVADGPFVEAKEVVGGYMIISAVDYDGAVEVVRACPAVQGPGVTLEIREMVGARA